MQHLPSATTKISVSPAPSILTQNLVNFSSYGLFCSVSFEVTRKYSTNTSQEKMLEFSMWFGFWFHFHLQIAHNRSLF